MFNDIEALLEIQPTQIRWTKYLFLGERFYCKSD
jgi:hypothetical protein